MISDNRAFIASISLIDLYKILARKNLCISFPEKDLWSFLLNLNKSLISLKSPLDIAPSILQNLAILLNTRSLPQNIFKSFNIFKVL